MFSAHASQNVDEAHPSVRADEFADAVQQQNHREQKHQGDPGPDSRSRGINDLLNERVGGDQKRDRIDRKAQCSKPVHDARRDLIRALSAPRSLLGVSQLLHLGEEMSASPTYLLRALVGAPRARRRAAIFRQISV